jgi:tetratricopeptide (TPR) repeat protein
MSALRPGRATGTRRGPVLLLAGCATAYQHGQTALHEGRYQEAAARFGEAPAEDPARVDALVGLGLAQYRLDAFHAAVGSLGRAVLAAPDRAEPRLYLALATWPSRIRRAAARQLEALAGLDVHPRIAAQRRGAAAAARRAAGRDARVRAQESRTRPTGIVSCSRRVRPTYLGPAWFVHDPAGWSPPMVPYGVPRP